MNGLITILGPTASGKSAVAVRLAQALEGEVVSCDSMMVYRGMDIGTAKPTAEERDGVSHHLIDIVDISEPYNVSRYTNDAERAVDTVFANSQTPILCGGTGLYAKALLEGYSLQPTDPSQRDAVNAVYAEHGAEALAVELRSAGADEDWVNRLSANPRHLMRAVEIVRLSGSLPTNAASGPAAGLQIVLMPSPELSRDRIAKRTQQMFEQGWIDETERLIDDGLLESPTAKQAMGYRLIADFLDGSPDVPTVDELQAQIITATCRYAKRQRTWFRHQHAGAHILPVADGDSVDSICTRVIDVINEDAKN